MQSLIKKPSAWLPIAMSALGISLILGFVLINGTSSVAQQTDEGATAHLFQLLMVLQVFIIGYFAVMELPKNVKAGLVILGLQVLAMAGAFGLVYYFER